MTEVQLYPDKSHHDVDRGDYDFDPDQLLVVKVSQGVSYIDPCWTPGSDAYEKVHGWSAARYLGVYHWIDGGDLDGQAVNVMRHAGNRPIMWDCEAPGATVPRIVSLTKKTRARGGNVRVAYLSHHWWQEGLGEPDLRPLTDLGLFIINAWYDDGYGDSAPGWKSYGGITPKILQYTSTPHDMNAFRGTQQQLLALWGFTEEDDMELTDVVTVWNGEKMTVESILGKTYTRAGGDPDKPELTQLQADVTEIKTTLAGLTAGTPLEPVEGGPLALSDADKDDIAGRVVAQLRQHPLTPQS